VPLAAEWRPVPLPQDFEYVPPDDVLDKDLQCSVCLGWPVDPVILGCPGGHMLCRRCVSGPLCPLDRQPYARFSAPQRPILTLLNRLRVFCPKAAEGCPWTGPRGNVLDHWAKCSFAEQECAQSAFQSGRVRGASRRPSAGGAATLRAASRRSAAKEPRAATGSQGAKQRDVPGVRWVPVKQCWITRWWEGAVNKVRTFSVRKYMAPGKTREEAKAEALRDAIALRKELVRTGKLKVKKTVLGSRIQGVHWNRARKGWQVRIMSDGKYLSGGYFRPKDNTPDEIERARLAAVERRRTLEHEHGVHEEAQHTSQLVEHDSGILGVTWSRFESQWHVQIALNGKKVNRRFRPKDDTLEEIERARLAAVQCRQDLERQKAEQVAAEPGGGCARP